MTFDATAASRPGWYRLIRLRVPRRHLIVWLELATFLYVGLPVVIWLLGWLKLPLAVILTAALAAAVGCSWWQTRRFFREAPADGEPPTLPLWPWVGAALAAVVWGIYSGAGGYTFTNPDWSKHFAILRDLTEFSWPVTYQVDERTVPLVYYFAYYLPAAAVGAKLGWSWACFTLMAWTCVGAVIAVSWFVVLVGARPFLAGMYFIFANGMDFLADRLVNGGAVPSGVAHIDWWAGWTFLNLPGHYSQMVWAPQHSLAAWAITGLLTVQLSAGRNLSHAGLLAGLGSFWSPFSLIGMIPLALFALVRARGRGILYFANLVGLALTLTHAAFLLSQNTHLPQGWAVNNWREEWPRFAFFVLFEWGLFALFASELRRSNNPRLRGFFWTAVTGLALIPLYELGMYNDWCMRVSIPSLFLLWAGVGRSLLRQPFSTEWRLLLVMVLFGSMGALLESARSWKTRVPHAPGIEAGQHIPLIPDEFARQYYGTDTSFFFRHLSRPYTPVKLTPPPP